jgi:hypothetical protein
MDHRITDLTRLISKEYCVPLLVALLLNIPCFALIRTKFESVLYNYNQAPFIINDSVGGRSDSPFMH